MMDCLSFYRDSSGYWKDKSYFWIQWENQCVGFIAIGNPDERDNRWTVWSADMGSEWLAEDTVEPCIRETAWKYIDHCGRCGSCSGGQRKVIFGKAFEDVCGCTFRLDNPQAADLPFLMKMVEIRLRELRSRSE